MEIFLILVVNIELDFPAKFCCSVYSQLTPVTL